MSVVCYNIFIFSLASCYGCVYKREGAGEKTLGATLFLVIPASLNVQPKRPPTFVPRCEFSLRNFEEKNTFGPTLLSPAHAPAVYHTQHTLLHVFAIRFVNESIKTVRFKTRKNASWRFTGTITALEIILIKRTCVSGQGRPGRPARSERAPAENDENEFSRNSSVLRIDLQSCVPRCSEYC